MKRSRAPSAVASQTTVTTTKQMKTAVPRTGKYFGKPSWAGNVRTGFPKELKFTHRYVSPLVLTSSSSSFQKNSFSCNGLYDPDATGTGSQPLYFDQLAALYNHYTVLSSKITIQLVPRSGMSVYGIYGVYINDDTTVTPASSDRACEQSTSSYTIVGSLQQPIKLRRSWNAKNAFGPGALSDPNLQGTSAANPTEQQFFTVFWQELAAAGTSQVVDAICTLEYTAMWQELKDIGGS